MKKRKDKKMRFSVQVLFEGEWYVLATNLTQDRAIARLAECERSNECAMIVPEYIITEGMTV